MVGASDRPITGGHHERKHEIKAVGKKCQRGFSLEVHSEDQLPKIFTQVDVLSS